MRSSILIIYTGGTIGMQTDAATGALVPFDFSGIYEEFPSLKRLNVAIDVHTLSPVIDSSNVSPENWVTLASLIRENYRRYDGFVVLHGTDTMSYTASALSFMFENLAKPVVFTGSQIPIGVLRTDGRENLITAIEIAGARDSEGRPLVPEVSLYFQNHLFRANRTTKRSAEALSAFYSYNYPPLADVGVNISYNQNLILQPEVRDEELRVATTLSTEVCVIKLFPGISESILRAILSTPNLKAVILETYGAGNAPTSEWFIRLLQEAIERGVIILNITQCKGGCVSMELYETGLRLLQIGVVSGYDMSTEAAVTKLMYLLGKNSSIEEVKAQLMTPLRGEFTR
jgi:L-asparaginase